MEPAPNPRSNIGVHEYPAEHRHFVRVESPKAMKWELAWFPGRADSRMIDVMLCATSAPAHAAAAEPHRRHPAL
jgi:hypothetical protein